MMLRVFWRLFANNVSVTLAYRGAFFLYMVLTVLSPLIALSVWLTVSEQGVALPYSRDQFVTYYVMLAFVVMLTGNWAAPYVADTIRTGSMSPWLLRPAPVALDYVANNLGEKVIKAPLLLPLVGLVALLFREDLSLPADPARWGLFALSLPLAAVLAFLLDFVIGILAFWIENVTGLARVKSVAGAFLEGQLVPLALFPAWLAPFLAAQPFRFVVSFPLEILTGRLNGPAIGWGFAAQAGYCIALFALYRV
ncbi:MAG TPA: ABC-2 family transporter protein, partial [Roseiflexaceae bacterium]|nr:ABC-2 family transporter protein [Roseiflexaceae bacterium]